MTILISLAFGCAFTASVMVAYRLGQLEERCHAQASQLHLMGFMLHSFHPEGPDDGEPMINEDLGENVVAIGKEAA